MEDHVQDTLERVARTRERAIESLRRAIEIERRVIEENMVLAQTPGHEESARQRVVDGQEQLATMEAELAALERGGQLDHPPTG